MEASKKRFRIGQESDPMEFMSWLLNTLHMDLIRTSKNGRTIIHECFQGELEVEKETINSKTSLRMPFLMLGLDLNIIPRVNLFDLRVAETLPQLVQLSEPYVQIYVLQEE